MGNSRRYEGVTDPEEAGRRVAEGFVPLISGMRGFVAWFDAGERRDGYQLEDRSHEEESKGRFVGTRLSEVLPNPTIIGHGRA